MKDLSISASAITVAQINSEAGNLKRNSALIFNAAHNALLHNSSFLFLPYGALEGYPLSFLETSSFFWEEYKETLLSLALSLKNSPAADIRVFLTLPSCFLSNPSYQSLFLSIPQLSFPSLCNADNPSDTMSSVIYLHQGTINLGRSLVPADNPTDNLSYKKDTLSNTFSDSDTPVSDRHTCVSTIISDNAASNNTFIKKLYTLTLFDKSSLKIEGDTPDLIFLSNPQAWTLLSSIDSHIHLENNSSSTISKKESSQSSQLFICTDSDYFEKDRPTCRHNTLTQYAQKSHIPLIYVNKVGGQENFVYDGSSTIINSQGQTIYQAPFCQAHTTTISLPNLLTSSQQHNNSHVKDNELSNYPIEKDFYIEDADKNAHAYPQKFFNLINSSSKISHPLNAPDISHPSDSTKTAVSSSQILSRTLISTSKKVSTSKKASTDPLILTECECEEIYTICVRGLQDYVRQVGLKGVVLGLSGGIDSALTAAIAADALHKENIYGISMPSEFSSTSSLKDAQDLAHSLGCRYFVEPINTLFDSFKNQLNLEGLAAENVQARIRGVIVMGYANTYNLLPLATGNKSELACGYSTIYGDTVGGYAPLKDIYKSWVWDLARWRNQWARQFNHVSPIPNSSIEKAPSAELHPHQKDSDSLPSYDILDAFLWRFLNNSHLDNNGSDNQNSLRNKSKHTLCTQTHEEQEIAQQILSLYQRAEWKRRQYPVGPKITPFTFGVEDSLPLGSTFLTDFTA